MILCADDFGIAAGVTRGIGELAEAGCLSAASAIVTLRRWGHDGSDLARLRGHIAVGLHLNLTLDAPLGPMPTHASDGRLPAIRDWTVATFRGRIASGEVAAEVARQIARFREGVGHDPDFIDGHQHVHALSGVRDGVIAALTAETWPRPPLIRDPADRVRAIARRGGAVRKALTVAALARGFGAAVRHAGFPANDSFAGFSAFAVGRPFADELATFGIAPGRRHLVMCHPGHPDAELAALDPVTLRRGEELAALLAVPGLPDRLWRPSRAADGPTIDWTAEAAIGARPHLESAA